VFYKKTYLDKSSIQGVGLFSGEDIAKGELVYKHSLKLQHVLESEELDALEEDEKRSFTHYGYFWKGKWYLDFDDVRFLNHDTKPNLILTDKGIEAARDILKGEELTQDYKDFEDKIRLC
jgi:hypothetical protein